MVDVENKTYPELKLRTKRMIFWSLIILFAGYSVIIYTKGTDYSQGAEAYTASAQRGKLVFQNYNCISCHQIYGLGGYMGPDLTNIMTSERKGRPYASALISVGTARMPKFDVSDDELVNLLDYLEYVGQAAHYPVTEFEITWYGDVNSKLPVND